MYKGERIVIPTSLRKEMLNIIHESHLGIVKCKQLARDLVFWPGINKQIEDLVSRCETCQAHRSYQQKEPLMPTEIPNAPWQIVACDLFDHDGSKYVIMADYYSDWFEVEKVTSTTATVIIGKTSKWFSQHGIPEKVITDNGPPFSSFQYKQFADRYGFTHQTISPYHSQANGLIEKCVGIIKAMLTKCAETKQDLFLALLNHRNTPMAGLGSPAQRLFGRRTKTRLPTSNSLLLPSTLSPDKISDGLKATRCKAKELYDKSAKHLPEIQPGDVVRIRDNGIWKPAIVQDSHQYRSHTMLTPQGKLYRRNRRDVLKTKEDGTIFQSDVDHNDNFEDLGLTSSSELNVPDNPTFSPSPKTPSTPVRIPSTKSTPVRIPSTPVRIPSTPVKPVTPSKVKQLAGPGISVSSFGRIRKPNPKYL
jgi:hypothetical protein